MRGCSTRTDDYNEWEDSDKPNLIGLGGIYEGCYYLMFYIVNVSNKKKKICLNHHDNFTFQRSNNAGIKNTRKKALQKYYIQVELRR